MRAQEPPATAAELKTKFERRLQEISTRVNGAVGYEILDLTSGERIGRLDRSVFPTASTIKLAIVYELFKQVDEGKVRLDQTIALDRAKAVGGSGVLAELGTPTLSLRDYATLMVIVSDNTATNVLIDVLGMNAVTARMNALGLTETKLRRHMIDVAAARRGDENVSTPAEIVRLLEAIWKGEGLSASSRQQALALLERPKASRLRRALPPGVEAADKPGELEGVRVDAGIVFVKNRPYILCVMTTFLNDETEGEDAIVAMSQAAYEYFSRIGAGGRYGRQIGETGRRRCDSARCDSARCDSASARTSAFHVERFFPQMQPQRPAAENREIRHPSSHPDALAACRRPQPLRDDGHFARAVVDFVHAERHEGHAPGARHDAADADGPVLVPARMPLKIRDVGIAQRQRARGGRHRQSRDRDDACDSINHGRTSSAYSRAPTKTGRARIVKTTRDAAMPAPA